MGVSQHGSVLRDLRDIQGLEELKYEGPFQNHIHIYIYTHSLRNSCVGLEGFGGASSGGLEHEV